MSLELPTSWNQADATILRQFLDTHPNVIGRLNSARPKLTDGPLTLEAKALMAERVNGYELALAELSTMMKDQASQPDSDFATIPRS